MFASKGLDAARRSLWQKKKQNGKPEFFNRQTETLSSRQDWVGLVVFGKCAL